MFEMVLRKIDATTTVLLFVIIVEAWLLVKALGRIDELVRELGKNSQTLARLTEMLNHLIYGREK